MMSPVTSRIRILVGSVGTLYVGWNRPSRLRAGGRPVRKAKLGWSEKSGAATSARTDEAAVVPARGAAALLQAANNTMATAMPAPPPLRRCAPPPHGVGR